MIKITEYNETYTIVNDDFDTVVNQFMTEQPRYSIISDTSAEFSFNVRGEYGWQSLIIRVYKIS